MKKEMPRNDGAAFTPPPSFPGLFLERDVDKLNRSIVKGNVQSICPLRIEIAFRAEVEVVMVVGVPERVPRIGSARGSGDDFLFHRNGSVQFIKCELRDRRGD